MGQRNRARVSRLQATVGSLRLLLGPGQNLGPASASLPQESHTTVFCKRSQEGAEWPNDLEQSPRPRLLLIPQQVSGVLGPACSPSPDLKPSNVTFKQPPGEDSWRQKLGRRFFRLVPTVSFLSTFARCGQRWGPGEGALPPGLPGLDAVSLGQMYLATAQGRSLGRAGAFESHGAWCLLRPHSATSLPRSIPPDGQHPS